ncbi:2-hydroxyacid dehydrogenase [Gordonia sp. NB41Y]|uniref:2-hydroxyacid dehydrogenase n=1 Tax=Gordonia sp. NB41Y TaxID=875808 RepID=UPI0006B1BA22|nr:2-hydroxyacid dehydrogenase [Gordonia sp. NB41Y]KOY49711.1 2-hydroxyacid dehydrogenase [Gordonia sp. NB41Y]WLP92865.1 2-hydroxyacid dehydrogenase [Gordonia sp. NB41Y]
MTKIVVADANLIPHRERFEQNLAAGLQVSWHPGFDESALLDDIVDADVLVGPRFTTALGARAEKLRLVHVAGAGTDGIDFSALPSQTLVANTFHHEQAIAEYVVATSTMLLRGFIDQDHALREARWASAVYDRSLPQGRTLGSSRIGFVGFGHIGRRTWELLRPFGSTGAAVTGSGRLDAAAEGLSWAGDVSRLTELAAESDVLVVSAPLTPDTVGMIAAPQLRALGPEGILVNVGRGGLVDEQAAFDALRNNVIRAAALDVWYTYPDADGHGTPGNLPFADLPNLLMTPHSSGIADHTFIGRADDITDNIARLLRGEPLINPVPRPHAVESEA